MVGCIGDMVNSFAILEAESECNIHYSGDFAMERLAYCLRQEGKSEEAQQVEEMARNWNAGK